MDATEAKGILRGVRATIPSAHWSPELTKAVQRGLASLWLLNPHGDVDGRMGPRTRGAWASFRSVTSQAGPDVIDAGSAGVLVSAMDDPSVLIGRPKVGLPHDFEFERNRGSANREPSVAAIIETARARELTRPQIAYVLATAEHESDSFQTLEEYASGIQYEGRHDLGNSQPGDGRRFKGRGYVQLTGRLNYTRYAQLSGVHLTSLPLILMNWPALSVFVIVDGMLRGIYTGHRLGDFVNGTTQDFFHARKVINGLDRADKIAEQARQWLHALN